MSAEAYLGREFSNWHVLGSPGRPATTQTVGFHLPGFRVSGLAGVVAPEKRSFQRLSGRIAEATGPGITLRTTV